MSKPDKKKMDLDEYYRLIKENRASKEVKADNDFDARLQKARKQGYSAARQGKIYPRELQNTPDDSWEDAKVYGKDTRQGQNHWRNHMKVHSEEMARRQKKKSGGSTTNADLLLRKNKR